MSGDPWPLFFSGAIVALITYALPKIIEGVFRKRLTSAEAEAAQEAIEERRWKKAQDDLKDQDAEIIRLRSILRRHNIDPNESGPLDKKQDKPQAKRF